MKRSAFALLAVVLTLILAIASAAADPHVERPKAGASDTTTAAPTDDLSTGLLRAQAHVEAVEADAFWSWATEVDAFLATLYVAPEPVAVVPEIATGGAPAPTGGATGECGGATNGADQFIMRESGGNPNAYNPSGAWGCYQIMPGTWAGAGCDELGAHGSASAAAQAQCASRLGLSAWNL
jgi:hypothetical protein